MEAILVRDGVVTEGAATTVFAVIDGVVRTHPPGHRILPEVTRDEVIACAAELGIALREGAFHEAELRAAQGMRKQYTEAQRAVLIDLVNS